MKKRVKAPETKMKSYRIPYATYPFNMDDVANYGPEWEENVQAETLTEAIAKVRKEYGDSIEIFEFAARKYYNEPADTQKNPEEA